MIRSALISNIWNESVKYLTRNKAKGNSRANVLGLKLNILNINYSWCWRDMMLDDNKKPWFARNFKISERGEDWWMSCFKWSKSHKDIEIIQVYFWIVDVFKSLCTSSLSSMSCNMNPSLGAIDLCFLSAVMASWSLMFFFIIRYARIIVADRLIPWKL